MKKILGVAMIFLSGCSFAVHEQTINLADGVIQAEADPNSISQGVINANVGDLIILSGYVHSDKEPLTEIQQARFYVPVPSRPDQAIKLVNETWTLRDGKQRYSLMFRCDKPGITMINLGQADSAEGIKMTPSCWEVHVKPYQRDVLSFIEK